MKTVFSSIQWSMFIMAGTIVAPLSIGFAFGMTQVETSELLQRTFFIIGLTCLLQALFGHKLPLHEGPAGLWWGVFLTFAGVSSAGLSAFEVLRSLELGLLISGGLFIIVGSMKLVNVVKKVFTPIVTGTYLILLVAQLSGPFVKGILGIGYISSDVHGIVAVAAIATLILSVVLTKSRNQFLVSYSVLITLAFGWILFYILGITDTTSNEVNALIKLPEVFAWGIPTFDLGVVLTAVLTMFLLLTNLIASIDVVKKVTEQTKVVSYNRAGFIMGINQMLSGLFSTMGGVPVSTAAGFILTTKIKEKLPFVIGSAIILMLSFFPMVMTFFASCPVPVGYATIFLSISMLVGMGLQEYKTILDHRNSVLIISLSLTAGIGIMFVPSEALKNFPSALASVLNNGLIIGVMICIVLEQIMKERRKTN
jgi:xanthine/uracil permease